MHRLARPQASKLSADFRESSERLKEELGSLQRSLAHLQALPRHEILSREQATHVDDGIREMDDAVESVVQMRGFQREQRADGANRTVSSVEPPSDRAGRRPVEAESLHFIERSQQLELSLKVRFHDNGPQCSL